MARRGPEGAARPYPVMLRIMRRPLPSLEDSAKRSFLSMPSERSIVDTPLPRRVECDGAFISIRGPSEDNPWQSRPPRRAGRAATSSRLRGWPGGVSSPGWPARLPGRGCSRPPPPPPAGLPGAARGQGMLKTITASHSVSTVVYGQHLVAAQKKFFEEEGVKTPAFIVPGGGARVVQAVAAGQAMFALGDSNHPLKTTEKGRDAIILFATDHRCSYANVVVRKELYDKGGKSMEALGDEKLVGRKAVIAATAIGSGTHVYGVYVCKNIKAGDGKPVNDHVEWGGGGPSTTMLGGLRGGKFDAIMAVPEWQSAAVSEGFGRAIYDIQDEKAWN